MLRILMRNKMVDSSIGSFRKQKTVHMMIVVQTSPVHRYNYSTLKENLTKLDRNEIYHIRSLLQKVVTISP